MEIVDRYSATGIPRPTKDSCDKCEGMGVNPEQKATLNEEALKSPTGTLLIIGQKNTEEDDWVFVQCPCGEPKEPKECCKQRDDEIVEKIKDMERYDFKEFDFQLINRNEIINFIKKG